MPPPSQREYTLNALIDSLEYDFSRFEMAAFKDYLEVRRRRPIQVLLLPFQNDIFGMWFPNVSADFVFLRDDLHPIHQTHVFLHEIAHMLLDHRSADLSGYLHAEAISVLGDTPLVGHLRSARADADRVEAEEIEAEVFVSLIQRRIFSAHRQNELYGDPTSIAAFLPTIRGLDF